MTASVRRRTRTRHHRTARRTRTVRIPWGWLLGAPLALYLVAKSWPVQTAIATVLLAAAGITYAIRARSGRAPRLNGRIRVALPHQRRHDRLLAHYQRMDGTAFEHAIADLARRDPDVHSATVEGGANDRALDVLVTLVTGHRIAIQCKRYSPRNRVPADAVYQVNGTYRDYHRCQLAAIVTTSGYTRDAISANACLTQPIRLIDGPALATWANGGPAPWN
ncbi:restriction endonuclease [Streptomyces sp. NPDC017529]|uniref:restriction endonuclease n=1 Tax=Streptomyces sp. NPDC017529 TaxID=3365000 RepID=UPI0037952706